MKILKPHEYYIEKIKKYHIPIAKVLDRLNYLEAEGFSTDEACEIISKEIREGRL